MINVQRDKEREYICDIFSFFLYLYSSNNDKLIQGYTKLYQ